MSKIISDYLANQLNVDDTDALTKLCNEIVVEIGVALDHAMTVGGAEVDEDLFTSLRNELGLFMDQGIDLGLNKNLGCESFNTYLTKRIGKKCYVTKTIWSKIVRSARGYVIDSRNGLDTSFTVPSSFSKEVVKL